MSADIIFGNGPMWSARVAGFNEILGRVRLRCGMDEPVVIEHLEFAEKVNCLNLDDIKNRDKRAKLTGHILAVSIELLEESKDGGQVQPEEIEHLRVLVSLSREFYERISKSEC